MVFSGQGCITRKGSHDGLMYIVQTLKELTSLVTQNFVKWTMPLLCIGMETV